MERRSFLLSAAAAVVHALSAWEKKPEPALVANGFTAPDASPLPDPGYEVHHFVADQVVVLVEGCRGLLAQGLVLTTYEPTGKGVPGSGRPPGPHATFTFPRLVGPVGDVCRFYNRYGNVLNAATNDMRLGFARTDGTTVWVGLRQCSLTQVGCSVQAADMLVTECVQGTSLGVPTLTDATRKQPVTAVSPDEIRAQLVGYPMPDRKQMRDDLLAQAYGCRMEQKPSHW